MHMNDASHSYASNFAHAYLMVLIRGIAAKPSILERSSSSFHREAGKRVLYDNLMPRES